MLFPSSCCSFNKKSCTFKTFFGLVLDVEGVGRRKVQIMDSNVVLSPPPKICFICLNKSPLELMKNAFHFTLKDLFIAKIFKPLPRLFNYVEKTD